MQIRRTIGETLFDWVNILFMILLILVTLYPMLHVTFASVSSPSLLMRHTGMLLHPLGLEFGAYRMVFRNPMIWGGYGNTLFYLVVGTTVNLIMTTLGAYVLSRRTPMLKNTIMFLIVFTMFFQGGLIPSFLLVQAIGLAGSRWALIFPSAMSAWNLIIMRTSFMAIPESMEESARIDGAKDLSILLRIIIPLSGPVIAVMILFYGVGHWNSWFPAMIYLRDRQLYPLQLILREILIANDLSNMLIGVGNLDREPVGETIKYATIMVATLPILSIYPFLQKYFVKGIMIGALKG
jgi:putative aldouronate transport system permease protein